MGKLTSNNDAWERELNPKYRGMRSNCCLESSLVILKSIHAYKSLLSSFPRAKWGENIAAKMETSECYSPCSKNFLGVHSFSKHTRPLGARC